MVGSGVMRTNFIRGSYFGWMCRMVGGRDEGDWRSLFRLLHSVEFVYILPMDENRMIDGLDLRNRFALENGYSENDVIEAFKDYPCSVFEMMVALAHRCEEQIMSDDEEGDRTSVWFFDMIRSLGLSGMRGNGFNEEKARAIVYIFLKRKYEPDGRGGLFTLEHPNRDMRGTEIWYQLQWYLNERNGF